MTRLFGVRVSDSQLLPCALYPFREDLTTEAVEDNREGWGIGFYQDDRVLVKKRPQALKERVVFADLAADLKSPALVGHARRPTSGVLAPEDTHPFQFRSWLFAHHGMLENFEARQETLEAQIPEFLRQHLAGHTDSERVFYLFLSALSDLTRQRLEDPTLRAEVVGRAIKDTLTRLDGIGPRGRERDTLNLLVTNSRVLVATGVGRPLFRATIEGITDCPRCRIPPLVTGREPTRVDHPHLRAALVASGLENYSGVWEKLPSGTLVLIDRDLGTRVEAL